MSKKDKTYHSNENMMEIPEVLKNVNKTSPFPVPDKYFEVFPAKIQGRVFNTEQKSVRNRTLLTSKKKLVFVPALSVVMIIVLFIIFNRGTVEDEFQFAGINLEETLDQYPEFFEDFEEETLIGILISASDENDFDASSVWSDTSITRDEILDYLEDENVDIEYLYNL